MDQQRIEQLQEEIRNLHYNPSQKSHSFSDNKTKDLFKDFWDFHLSFVIEKSKKMAEKYNADIEVIWLSAMLHDIARLDDLEPHDEIGSKRAYSMLIERGFSEDVALKVKNVILTHRCKQYAPENVEQKIVATADALAHFVPPFYLWISNTGNKPFRELLEGNAQKLERDYHKKIFFDDERKQIEPYYQVLKSWFE